MKETNRNIGHFFLNLIKSAIILALVQKELKTRYASSSLGILWTIVQPLSQIVIYSIVFSLVFHTPIPKQYNNAPYVIFLLCAMIPYQFFSDTVSRATDILIQNTTIITKTQFPFELFPVAALITSFVSGLITLTLTLLLMVGLNIIPSIKTIIYLPLYSLPLFLFTLGVSWIVSSISVIVRDIAHTIPLLLHLMFFATPVLYSSEMVGKMKDTHPFLVFLAQLNPLFCIVEGYRQALIGNEFILSSNLTIQCYIFSLFIFIFGGYLFNSLKHEIIDTL